MIEKSEINHRALLTKIAHQAMLDRGMLPDFSPAALHQVSEIKGPAMERGESIRDLRDLLWCSIDNDDSRDLDQLTFAEKLTGGRVRVLVAIADVDALVDAGTAIDDHARHNTTSVYTAAVIFPMIPGKLSTDLTSLNSHEDRLALVVEMVLDTDGNLLSSEVFRGLVRNRARLAYDNVAAWLEGKEELPAQAAALDGLDETLRLQDGVAQQMKNLRHVRGALSFETVSAKLDFDGDRIGSLSFSKKNRAREIIEDFMIAANGVVARFLASNEFPSIMRVVHAPKRWDRIVELADEYGTKLPGEPNSIELERFLKEQKARDPLRFPDLSLAVIKLLGAGEYIVDLPDEISYGHFGLAVKDYTHSTAPNRRYTDLITHRLLKAALNGNPVPYSLEELEFLARHCTEQEDAANKVERQVGKSAVAVLLESRIGEEFSAIVTGASEKGTWVRLLEMPVEGKLVRGFAGLDVGQRVNVRLVFVDVERGYIDFKRVKR